MIHLYCHQATAHHSRPAGKLGQLHAPCSSHIRWMSLVATKVAVPPAQTTQQVLQLDIQHILHDQKLCRLELSLLRELSLHVVIASGSLQVPCHTKTAADVC